MSQLYPIMLDITGKRCVVVGGGDVATRKATTISEAGADTLLVAPDISKNIDQLAVAGSIRVIKEDFKPSHIDGAFLVFAATNSNDVNQTVKNEAEARNILVNVVDAPEKCTFFVPSKVNRGKLTIAISTGAASPAVARKVRKQLEEEFGQEWEAYLDLLVNAREKAKKSLSDPKKRRTALKQLADSTLFDLVKSGDYEAAEKLVDSMIAAGSQS